MDAEVFVLDRSPQRLRGLAAHIATVLTVYGVPHDAVGTMSGAVPFNSTKAWVSVNLARHPLPSLGLHKVTDQQRKRSKCLTDPQ